VVIGARRARSDEPAAIQQAIKTTTMPSLLRGSYALDEHNHAHTPLQILGLHDGRLAVSQRKVRRSLKTVETEMQLRPTAVLHTMSALSRH
jgi:hypothetical protein